MTPIVFMGLKDKDQRTYLTRFKYMPVDEMNRITHIVCNNLGVFYFNLKSPSRLHSVVQARQICMYFIRERMKSKLKDIGEFFGGRDHSTVISSIECVKDLMETDKNYKSVVIRIGKLL